MNDLARRIEDLSDKYFETVRDIRRHIHQHPELSFEEKETSLYIRSILDELGVNYTTGWAGHGIVAKITGNGSGKKLALRADLDALPILEANQVNYASKNEGVMHACGHDVHTSSLLGALTILNETKDQWMGSISFIFQPGEEKLPGGAFIMLKENALGTDLPDSIFGQHVHPPLEVGKVGFRPGMYMASADELYFTVTGQGGHAALPADCIDPIVTASQIILGLQQIVARFSNPQIPTVLSIGKINSIGGATNVIPNKVKMEGTFRTFDEEWRMEAHRMIEKISSEIASSFGAVCEVKVKKGYPALINDDELTKRNMESAREYLGDENVVLLDMRTTAEDFAYFSQKIPACFYRLGTGNPEKGIISPVHTNTFDIDEDALKVGMGLMAYLSVSYLNK